MKKLLISLIIAAGVVTSASAQHIETGLNYQRISVEGTVRYLVEHTSSHTTSYTTTRTIDGASEMIGIYAAYYHPLLIINDDLALGGYGGAKFLFSYFEGGSSPLDLGFQLPVAAIFKYGSQATYDSEHLLGGGVGAGVVFSAFNLETPVESKYTNISPYILAEVTAFDNFTLRFHYNLLKSKTHYDSSLGEVPKLTYSTFGLDLAFLITW